MSLPKVSFSNYYGTLYPQGSGDASNQDLWFTVSGNTGTTSADQLQDTLNIVGGTGITTEVSGDTLTVRYVGGGVSGLSEIIGDTTPQLGGNLDVNGRSIVSTGNGNISIVPAGSGSVVLKGLTFPNTDGADNQYLTTDGSGNLSFADINVSNDTWFVSKQGSDTNGNGSFNRPYATPAKAVAEAGFGDIIFVMPGEYSGNITIGVDNLTIVGFAPRSSHPTVINGTITIPAGRTRLRMVDLRVDAQDNGPCIDDQGSEGRHYFDNITFVTSDSTSNVGYLGTNAKRWRQFMDCEFSGNSEFVFTGAGSNPSAWFHGISAIGAVRMDHSGHTVHMENGRAAGPFYHDGGTLYINNMRILLADGSGNVINSTAAAGNGTLVIKDTDTATLGKINKTGSCTYVFQGVTKNAADVINGSELPVHFMFSGINTNSIQSESALAVGDGSNRQSWLASVPGSSKGAAGDAAGMLAFDADYMYVCTGSYNGTANIWKRVELDGTSF